MNTRQLQYVLAVAQERSFSETAKKLMISQPSLSQYIQKLEQELGVALFERSNPLRLTYAGERYVEYARRILDEERQLEQIIDDIGEQRAGRLIIGIGPHNSTWILPYAVNRFSAEFPRMKIEVREMPEMELHLSAKRGEYDFAITSNNIIDPDLRYIPILEEEYLMAAPSDSEINGRLRGGANADELVEADMREFRNEPFVALETGLVTRTILDELCAGAGFEPLTRLECRSLPVAIAMVQARVGVGLFPSGMFRFQRRPDNVVCYRLKQSRHKRMLGVFLRKNQYISSAIGRFIDILKQY